MEKEIKISEIEEKIENAIKIARANENINEIFETIKPLWILVESKDLTNLIYNDSNSGNMDKYLSSFSGLQL
ncbi:MAG: hypothetical protein L0Y79_10225 [Chlorobi bacterium]|nr:hypothetical protein [Chlorobiota bacterium]MCI0716328.1 hypothetical protein [Chlorobiota bacterium]